MGIYVGAVVMLQDCTILSPSQLLQSLFHPTLFDGNNFDKLKHEISVPILFTMPLNPTH